MWVVSGDEQLTPLEHAGIKQGDYPQSSKDFAPVGSKDRQTQLANLIGAQTAYIEENKLEIRVATHSFGVRKVVYRVANLVGIAKDFIGQALPDEPHCQLAWAGVCLLLPVSPAVFCRCIVTPMADSTSSYSLTQRCRMQLQPMGLISCPVSLYDIVLLN